MKYRVLIVDDEADSREALAELTQRWGYDVQTASDGTEALRRAIELAPGHESAWINLGNIHQVIGDFDADGATSTAVVVRQLRRLGFTDPGFLGDGGNYDGKFAVVLAVAAWAWSRFYREPRCRPLIIRCSKLPENWPGKANWQPIRWLWNRIPPLL